jgi:hypothetical protein
MKGAEGVGEAHQGRSEIDVGQRTSAYMTFNLLWNILNFQIWHNFYL